VPKHDAIVVREYGADGQTIAVLHGGPGGQGSAASLASALAAWFGVREPLQRRSGDRPLTVDVHVRDLAAVTPNPAVLVGWSWGAMLALSFAARFPGDTRALALIGCGTYDERARETYQRDLDCRLGPKGRADVHRLRRDLADEASLPRRNRLFADLVRVIDRAQSFEPISDATMSASDSELPPDYVGHLETWSDALHRQARGLEPASFAAIRAPVLMVHGDQDPHPGPATRDTLRHHIPQLEYRALARCGHTPWLERHARDDFLALLRDWLLAVAG
jgi:pimeloyl-ACP methyl ester carboxylesterase